MSADTQKSVETPPLGVRDNSVIKEAQQAMRRADRWLQAVMDDADRVFVKHRAKPRTQPR